MKFGRKRSGRQFTRRATVLTQGVIFGSAVGVGVMALAIDSGLMYTAKQELQNAADAAALAAASQLGSGEDAHDLAASEGAAFSVLNKVRGVGAHIDVESDVVFGHAVMVGERYEFHPDETPYDAVQVRVRRDATVADGPVSLAFARVFGLSGARLQADATAMLVPRDIALVIDESGSMNDDSELRHYKDFVSENGGTRPGVQINLEDVWLKLPCTRGNNGVGNGVDPQPPGNPSNYNDQPGTGPGSPNSQGGNPSPGANPSPGGGCGGPRWGWMTGFGNTIVLGSYTPVGDPGLYYVPRNATCTHADVIANLTEAGYSAAERSALLSGQFDGNMTFYRNRVKVCLGLAGWRSKKSGGKYNGGPGNGDDKVDNNELFHVSNYNFSGGSWDGYVDYVSNVSEMRNTDPNFQYRYGIKTFVNYRMERFGNNANMPEFAGAPEMPFQSVKDSVQTLIDYIVENETQDHVSLEVFAQYACHLRNLSVPEGGQTLADALQLVASAMKQRQSGHTTSLTNIGGGLDAAITELTSDRARAAAAKVIILLTDGKPNVDGNGAYVGNNHANALSWCGDRADYAKSGGMTVYCVGVGADVNEDLLVSMASRPEYYFFANGDPDPENGGVPMYVSQLQTIFETLGGRRPVRLIE